MTVENSTQIPGIGTGTDLTQIPIEHIQQWIKANHQRYLDELENIENPQLTEFHKTYDSVVAYVQFLYAIDAGIYESILKAIVGQNIEIQ